MTLVILGGDCLHAEPIWCVKWWKRTTDHPSIRSNDDKRGTHCWSTR